MFAATVNAGVALPVPLVLPALIVIQLAWELAVQLQAPPVVRPTVRTSDEPPVVNVCGDTVNVQLPF